MNAAIELQVRLAQVFTVDAVVSVLDKLETMDAESGLEAAPLLALRSAANVHRVEAQRIPQCWRCATGSPVATWLAFPKAGQRRGSVAIGSLRRMQMPNINEPASGHGKITSPAGNRYWEYSNADALKTLKKAVAIIENNVKGMRPCNDCFKKLPGGRSFDDVWADNAVWINYEPRADRGWYGITLGVGGTEVSISELAFRKGYWWVAGTLVHELAHVNGAPINTAAADQTLLKCGLKNAYEGVIGVLPSSNPDCLV